MTAESIYQLSLALSGEKDEGGSAWLNQLSVLLAETLPYENALRRGKALPERASAPRIRAREEYIGYQHMLSAAALPYGLAALIAETRGKSALAAMLHSRYLEALKRSRPYLFHDIRDVYKPGTRRAKAVPGRAFSVYTMSFNTALNQAEYSDDAAGMTPGALWDESPLFAAIRPCLLKKGARTEYLPPDDFSSPDPSADVMIEIPRLGYSVTADGAGYTVRLTDNPSLPGFCYHAHTRRRAGDRDFLYLGAYLGSEEEGRLRSVGAAMPVRERSMTESRALAQAGGSGYDLLSFYPLVLLQCLFAMRTGGFNSEKLFGKGPKECAAAGALSGAGMYAVSSDRVKFLGMEDLWGNLNLWIDGARTDESRRLKTAHADFGMDSSYTARGVLSAGNINAIYMGRAQGNNDMGFLYRAGGGSPNGVFGDAATVMPSRPMKNTGSYADSGSGRGGLFASCFQTDAGDAATGCRLMYL